MTLSDGTWLRSRPKSSLQMSEPASRNDSAGKTVPVVPRRRLLMRCTYFGTSLPWTAAAELIHDKLREEVWAGWGSPGLSSSEGGLAETRKALRRRHCRAKPGCAPRRPPVSYTSHQMYRPGPAG
jgi:hypothetical protein